MTGGASVRVWCFTSQALCFAAQRNNALRHKDTSQQGEARSIPDRPFFCCPHKRAFGASWHTQRASVPCACWADSEATLNRANSEVQCVFCFLWPPPAQARSSTACTNLVPHRHPNGQA